MSPVLGRTDDMLIIRGVNVFRSQIEAVVVQFPDLSPHYQVVVARERTPDSVEVRVEVASAVAPSLGAVDGDASAVVALRQDIAERLRGVIGIHARVTLAAPGSLPRSEGGKLRRVVDQRPRQ